MTRMGQTTSAPTETAADRAVVRRLVLGSALDAVPRAGPDPVARLEHRAPVVLLELRAARLVPRHRRRLPRQPPELDPDPRGAGPAGAAGGRRAAVAGLARPHRLRRHLLHLAPGDRAAGVAGPSRGLRRRGARAGRPGRDRRPVLRGPDAADGVPLGPGRLARRHRRVHRAVVPLGAAGGLGRRRRPGLRAARAEPQAGAVDRGGHGRGRRAARGVDGGRDQLVAVLQDDDEGRRPGQPRLRGHLGQRHPAPADGAGAVEARAGRAAVLHAVPADQGQLPRRRAHRRRRLGLGRRDRAVEGRHPRRRRRHRPADHADRRRAQPRPGLREPAGDPARQRRPRVPHGHRTRSTT